MPRIKKNFLGIDPGKNGGLAIINEDQKLLWFASIPPSTRDLWEVIKEVNESFRLHSCSVEQVRSRPGEGHVGAFTFGRGLGRIEMALAGNYISFQEVNPKTWLKGLGVPGRNKHEKKGLFKERLRVKAQNMFPNLGIWSEPKSLGRQRAVCDAMLIADYQRRYISGE